MEGVIAISDNRHRKRADSLVNYHPTAAKTDGYKFLIYLGRISYGLYVFHIFGIHLAHRILESIQEGLQEGSKQFFIVRFLLALLITFGLSAVSYKYIEMPFLKLKKKFTFVESRPNF